MSSSHSPTPGLAPLHASLSAQEVLDTYFLETRAKLLEIAATLDRLDRTADRTTVANDGRLGFIADALAILQSKEHNRAELIQRRYSK